MGAEALSSEPRAGRSDGPGGSPAGGRRLVLFLPGHDPTDMDYHYGRFVNQAGRFGTLWSAEVEVSQRLDDGTEPSARWNVAARGPNWGHATDYEILRWDDIVVALDERPDPVRLWRGFSALADFLVTGTAWRYLRACVRYGLFFFFPFFVVGLFAAVGALGGWLASIGFALLLPEPFPPLLGLAVGLVVFFALFHQPGRNWRLHQALDDWDLAQKYMRGRTPTLDARLDQHAAVLVQRVASGRYDEVVLVGHSLGATLILRVISRALDLMPTLADGPARICLLTVGATIPKLSLHPRGAGVRAEAKRVSSTPGLFWAEYQARHDAINFHKFHPVLLRRTGFDRPGEAAATLPVLRDANIKNMLERDSFRRHRWSAMRIHYQFLLANQKRAPYDYFMFALGPLAFADIVASRDGAAALIGPDGALLSSPAVTDAS